VVLKPGVVLVRLPRVADDQELVDFCREEWPRLVGSLSLYAGRPHLAEDLAQEALYRVCRHWRSVRTADSPSAWAHRVAFNLAASDGRRRAAWNRARDRMPAPTPLLVVDHAEAVAVRDAVAALPEPQRAAIVLRYFAHLTVAETAEAMRCPQNTVKTHTRRAILAMRASGLLGDDDVSAELPDVEEAR
jgi:RNA polymerase sigma factor (sigma-70 family)